jgi:hypothetical protein
MGFFGSFEYGSLQATTHSNTLAGVFADAWFFPTVVFAYRAN